VRYWWSLDFSLHQEQTEQEEQEEHGCVPIATRSHRTNQEIRCSLRTSVAAAVIRACEAPAILINYYAITAAIVNKFYISRIK